LKARAEKNKIFRITWGIKLVDVFNLLSNTADGVFAIGSDHRIIFWNKAAQDILGFNSKEVLGEYCHNVIFGRTESGEVLCSKSCCVMDSIEKGKKVKNFDTLAHTKAGAPVWINVSIIAIPSRHEDLNIAVHIFRDITQRKREQILIKKIISTMKPEDQAEKDLYINKITTLSSKPRNKLTRREYDVLRLLAEGRSAKDIAEELYISWSTARKHIQNILTKLGLHSKLEAVTYAFRNNMF
jgi:PAS domain S-box-containing protein